MNGAEEKTAIVGVLDKNEDILFPHKCYIWQILLFIKLPRLQKQAVRGPEVPVWFEPWHPFRPLYYFFILSHVLNSERGEVFPQTYKAEK